MTLEDLQRKMELWKGAWPKLTDTALKSGTDVLRDEIKRRWMGQVLSPRTGKLVRAVKSTVKMNPISAKVEVDQKQQYKAQTHEYGKTITGQTHRHAYKRDSGGTLRRMDRPKTSIYMQLGPPDAKFFGRPHSVTIPARPVFHQAKQDKIKQILDTIEYTIVKGYKDA